MSAVEFVLAIAAVAGGAIVQGSVGVGLSLVAAPPLVAIDPTFIPGPLLIVGQIVGIRHIIVEGKHIDWRAIRNALWGLPVGIVGGLAVFELVPEAVRTVLIGALVAGSALVLLAGFRLRQTRRTEFAGGLTCSFGAMAAALPATVPLKNGLSSWIECRNIQYASVTVEGMATTSPGTWANQVSRCWECWGPCPVPASDGVRITIGTATCPPDM